MCKSRKKSMGKNHIRNEFKDYKLRKTEIKKIYENVEIKDKNYLKYDLDSYRDLPDFQSSL